jgi:NitT/TauT family transport system permease protein
MTLGSRLVRFGAAGLLIVVLWTTVSLSGFVLATTIPQPWAVLSTIVKQRSFYVEHLWITVVTAGIGLLVGSVVGVGMALLRIFWRVGAELIEGLAVMLRTIPIVALAPLLSIAFGTGLLARIAVAALICFFPIFASFVAGTARIDREHLMLSRLYGASTIQEFWLLRLPAAIPQVLAALPMAATLAVLGALIAEFLGSGEGLGFVILRTLYRLDAIGLYATTVLCGCLGIVFYVLASACEVFFNRFIEGVRVDSLEEVQL